MQSAVAGARRHSSLVPPEQQSGLPLHSRPPTLALQHGASALGIVDTQVRRKARSTPDSLRDLQSQLGLPGKRKREKAKRLRHQRLQGRLGALPSTARSRRQRNIIREHGEMSRKGAELNLLLRLRTDLSLLC